MNPIAEEIASYLGSASMTDEEFIQHYGKGHLDGGHSGRFPWGSGDDPYQHATDFLGRIKELKKNGWKDTPENIEKEFGLTTTEYRMEISLCNDARKMAVIARAKNLRDNDGYSTSEIGRRMGVNESTVRGWFEQEKKLKYKQSEETANFLKKQVDEKRMIDVGSGVERDLNEELRVSRQKFDTALYMLESQGYHVYGGRVPQPTNKNQMTTLKILCAPDVKSNEIYEYDKIKTIKDYISRDDGESFEKKFTYPESLNSKRLMVRYADDVGPDGYKGIDKDGTIEIRRGVPDLSLGESRYSQVRILVDGTHYIKGMAYYSDDMPDGVDVVFNTNKKKSTPVMGPKDNSVLKPIKKDPENPFGSAIKDADQGGQYWYDEKTGLRCSANDKTVKNKKLGLINKRADEGDWSDWADALPSQFLSKQAQPMIKKQLELAKADKMAEYDEIMKLTNPTVKKYYLDKFASSCDSTAVSLKAAALPGQKYHVIMPINAMGDDKIYAPRYANGTKLALVRYPHGGIFEIPVLTVDNKNPIARKMLGTDAVDAVGISKKNADRLSGADFDGDTVMCIPTDDPKGKVRVSRRPLLEGLDGFDSKEYKFDESSTDKNGVTHYYRNGKEFKVMKATNTQMGIISNLITDMTLLGANENELAAAVRHSMVVIDAEKHKLDYKQSEKDNNIALLQKKYQPKFDEQGNVIGGGGASTIVSKSKGEKPVLKRKGQARINIKGKSWYDPTKPEGSLLYTTAPDSEIYYADSTYDKKTGKKTIKTTDGKSITYDMNNEKEREKYEPIMRKDTKTGEVYYTNKDGSIKYRTKERTIKSTNMAETYDASTLVSVNRHPVEILYADYANSMKAMANNARKAMVTAGKIEYNPKANKIYQKEVSSLEASLNEALKNEPKERTAARLATADIKRAKEMDPNMKPGDEKKLSQMAISKYRSEVGSVSRRERGIKISDKEWEAIQAGAITEHKLKQILENTDPDSLRQRAMPKDKSTLSTAQINRIKKLNMSNFTLEEIAEKMNLSKSTISNYLKGEK